MENNMNIYKVKFTLMSHRNKPSYVKIIKKYEVIEETPKTYHIDNEDRDDFKQLKKIKLNLLDETILKDGETVFARIVYTDSKEDIDNYEKKYKINAEAHFNRKKEQVAACLKQVDACLNEINSI